MKFPRCILGILILPLLLSMNCAVGPQLSPMQKRQITTRLIYGSYEDTYRASLTVLQDQGYVIKNTDMASGLIVANVDRSQSAGSQITQALFLGYVANKGSEIEISCMVNKMTEDRTEVRLNIQETMYGQASVWSGTSKQNAKQIYDPEIYRSIFNEIEVEVKRRQAIAGNKISAINSEQNESTLDNSETTSNSHEQNMVDSLFAGKNKPPIYLDIASTAKGKYMLL